MKTIPLYTGPKSDWALDSITPLELPDNCRACALANGNDDKHKTMHADGEPGGLLVIGDYPTRQDDRSKRPFSGESGKYLRRLIDDLWPGFIAYDYAVRCPLGNSTVPESAIKACGHYTVQTFNEVKPKKVLLLGASAIKAVMGRELSIFGVRKAYAWVRAPYGDVPVYMMPNPAVALRNRFVKKWFEEDIKWALTKEPPFKAQYEARGHVIESLQDALQACSELRNGEWVSFDTETVGQMFTEFKVICLTACIKGSSDVYIWGPDSLQDPARLAPLLGLLKDESVKKIGQNIKFDELAVACSFNVTVRGIHGDTRLARKLQDPEADGGLAVMAELVGMGGHKAEAKEELVTARDRLRNIVKLNQDMKKGKLLFTDVDYGNIPHTMAAKLIEYPDDPLKYAYGLLSTDVLLRYCARDTLSTSLLYELMEQRLQEDEPNLGKAYRNTVMPAALAIRQVEAWGIPVDRGAVQHFEEFLHALEVELRLKMQQYGNFDPRSNEDVSNLLFTKLRLPMQNMTATNKPSVDKEALEKLKGMHPIVDDILFFRKITKLDSNYATGLGRFIAGDGRIHPSIMIDGARSGRMSCLAPNMQTIPAASDKWEGGRFARSCFAAPLGSVMVSIDYSQLELRIAAMLSGDTVMQEIFKSGEDLHLATAKMISKIAWGIEPEQVTSEHRRAAKSVNFGVVYGLTEEGLAADLHCEVSIARRIRQAILGKFFRLEEWTKEQLQQARRTGYTWTWWNGEKYRRRSLWRIAEDDSNDRGTAERSSWNSPVQGTGSDFLTNSLVEIVNWICDNGVPAKFILPVHDSVLMEVKEDCLWEVIEQCASIMQGWNSCGVPLVVDVEIGPSWGNLEKYKLVEGVWGKPKIS